MTTVTIMFPSKLILIAIFTSAGWAQFAQCGSGFEWVRVAIFFLFGRRCSNHFRQRFRRHGWFFRTQTPYHRIHVLLVRGWTLRVVTVSSPLNV